MTRRMLVLAILPVLIFALAGVAQAWQGRMGGMGDPYGLLSDEADFLIHPAKIAKGEGVRFYGDYRFTYTGVTDWDSHLEFYDAGVLDWREDFDLSGDEYGHDALVGAAFPLGPGRMGLFFTYARQSGDYSGDWQWWGYYPDTDLERSLDDFALRILYGLPAGGVNLGVEAQVAYRQEEKKYSLASDDQGLYTHWVTNPSYFWWNWDDLWLPSHLPIGFFPYESSYWDVLLKGSAEFALGPADVEFVLRGGFIVSGDNEWESEFHDLDGNYWSEDMDGDVGGWNIGGDLWVRVPVGSGLSLPFLVRVDYQKKTRDGDGVTEDWSYNHKITEKNLLLEAGGGLDKEISKTTRIAGGIYYNYLQRQENRNYHGTEMPSYPYQFDTDFENPDLTEHQIRVRFAGEHEFSPMFTLRAGLNAFYGWMTLKSSYSYFSYDWDFPWGWLWRYNSTADGSHWGIGGSLGASIRVIPGFTLEPFFQGGWQQLDLDGDGDALWADMSGGPSPYTLEEERNRDQWSISGGMSILFDL